MGTATYKEVRADALQASINTLVMSTFNYPRNNVE